MSHTFIRRELLEIERRGHFVLRLAIRRSESELKDPVDRSELEKTCVCLGQPLHHLLAATVRVALRRPGSFLGTLMLALRGWRRSDRSLIRHAAYLVEAAFLLGALKRNAVQHVHVHFGTNAATVARLIRRLGGPSYSIMVHGPDEFDAPAALDLSGKVEDAAFVTTISDFATAQVKRWSDPSDWAKVHVIHCTVGEEFLDAERVEPPQETRFVSVGRLSPQKGQLLLLDALAEVIRRGVEARLVLVGDGELRRTIEAQARRLGIEGRVELVGALPETEVRRHIQQARALVMSSFAEGLPMVIMEALALGRPVIATAIAGIPELVQPGRTGWLVTPGRAEPVADAMVAAANLSADEITRMGEAGRELVRRHHNTRTEGERLATLFHRAVDPGTSGDDTAISGF